MTHRHRWMIGAAIAAAAAAFGALIAWDARRFTPPSAVADLRDPQRIAAGAPIYAAHCAACHGANLEGQPNWKERRLNGRMPAPPHDDSGHTWHHPNAVLFGITRNGMKPPLAPPGYESDMPAYAGVLSDEQIWNVLAYIQSRWSAEVREKHAQLEREAQRN